MRINARLDDTTTVLDTPINQIGGGLSRAFVILHYFYAHRENGDEFNENAGMCRAHLWDDAGQHSVRVVRDTAVANINVSYTIIEALDRQFTVQRGLLTFDENDGDTIPVTLNTPVDPRYAAPPPSPPTSDARIGGDRT